eukprot:gene11079-biopygen289
MNTGLLAAKWPPFASERYRPAPRRRAFALWSPYEPIFVSSIRRLKRALGLMAMSRLAEGIRLNWRSQEPPRGQGGVCPGQKKPLKCRKFDFLVVPPGCHIRPPWGANGPEYRFLGRQMATFCIRTAPASPGAPCICLMVAL